MTAHIMCLTSSGGIPLFVRKKGDGELMTFSKMASLNGVHMFLKNHNIELLNTEIPDSTVAWKEFHDSIILITIACGVTHRVLNTFLEAVFNSMILMVGLDEIKKPRSIERLKRDLRSCYPVIDKLLECLDNGDRTGTKTDLLNMTSCIMCPENHLLQMSLESYLETLDSTYGCLLVHDCIAVATESWWSLDPIERKLLIIAVTSDSTYTAKDIPIFLPIKSPNVAYRLVNVTLINNIQVLALCGPTPELVEIEKLAVQCWRSNIELLRLAEQCYPRNFSSTIILDSGMLGFLIVNYKVGKFVLSKNSHNPKNLVSGSHRLDTLRSFYQHAVETFLLSYKKETSSSFNFTFTGTKETYWCSEYHKCHALKDGDHILCCLYTSSVSSHTMRLITKKTLKLLLSEKQTCW